MGMRIGSQKTLKTPTEELGCLKKNHLPDISSPVFSVCLFENLSFLFVGHQEMFFLQGLTFAMLTLSRVPLYALTVLDC